MIANPEDIKDTVLSSLDPSRAARPYRIHFPIEGQGPFALMMKVLPLGALIFLAAIPFVLSDPDMGIGLPGWMIFLGCAAMVGFEYLVICQMMLKRGGNYARYRITEGHVQVFPFSWMWIGASPVGRDMPISQFRGVSVMQPDKFTNIVRLVHEDPGYTIPVRYFRNPKDAKAYAQELAAALDLSVIPAESTERKVVPRAKTSRQGNESGPIRRRGF